MPKLITIWQILPKFLAVLFMLLAMVTELLDLQTAREGVWLMLLAIFFMLAYIAERLDA